MSTAARSGRFVALAFLFACATRAFTGEPPTTQPADRPVAKPSAASAADPNAVVYWAGKGYGVYHAAGCRKLPEKSSPQKISLADALTRKLKPCPDCNPPDTRDMPAATLRTQQLREQLDEYARALSGDALDLKIFSAYDALESRRAEFEAAGLGIPYSVLLKQMTTAIVASANSWSGMSYGPEWDGLRALSTHPGKTGMLITVRGRIVDMHDGAASVMISAYTEKSRRTDVVFMTKPPAPQNWAVGQLVTVIGRLAEPDAEQRNGAPRAVKLLPGTE